MAYRIEYGKNPKYPVPGRGRNWNKVLPVRLLVIAFAAAGYYVVKVVGLQNLLPGDPVVTGTALDTMVESLRSGIPAGEAFAVFCEEIVSHAYFFE